ncbi:serine/arginine repetitive matrix protein 3-like [Balaenoptera acutorostrata]|uniref:Serine/arginine repetitive matrix protein 3-like n=1 Tax=Balaenoptera acutorostrata TaxID=9767 RepID=A0ABM3SCX0_BALAC|nr:serine/arginine repetitive matrix protein 3-like [Balaenoptera acutorostrata]
MTDAAEAAFSPPTPPSRCFRRAPCPRLLRPLPRRSRVRAPPPPRRSRRASGPGRAPAGAGEGAGAGAGAGARVGAAAGGPAASSRDPRAPRPAPRPETARNLLPEEERVIDASSRPSAGFL